MKVRDVPLGGVYRRPNNLDRPKRREYWMKQEANIHRPVRRAFFRKAWMAISGNIGNSSTIDDLDEEVEFIE